MHGRGMADLLDAVVGALPEVAESAPSEGGPRRVALVGKPNVGKSSLLNRLAGDQRSVVHDVAGTTVDPVDSLIEMDGKVWRFVDTAGLRRKVGQASGHEFYASVRTHGAIDAAEVVIVLIDGSVPLTEQDQRVLSMVIEAGRALVLAFNKWDLGRRGAAIPAGQRDRPRTGAGALGAAGQHLRENRTGRAEAGAGPGKRVGVVGYPDRHRSAQHLGQGSGRRDTAAGARRSSSRESCSPPRPPPVRRRSCCSRPASWRRAIGGSWSDGCARRSGSRAARFGSTCGCARSEKPSADHGAEIAPDRVCSVPLSHAILIVIAGLGAGAINAVVGSGTLITFPTLVAMGYPPVTSTMSNAVGLVAGNVSGTWGYRRELRGQWNRLRWQLPASVLGALLGAWLLLHLPEKVFAEVVPVLLVAALIMVVIGPRIQVMGAGPSRKGRPLGRRHFAAADGRIGGEHLRGRLCTAATSLRRKASCWSVPWARCCRNRCSG